MSNTTRKGRKELPISQRTRTMNSKSINNSKPFSIISLNAAVLKTIIKRYKLMNWIEIHDPIISRKLTIAREKLRVRGWKANCQANKSHKQAGRAIL